MGVGSVGELKRKYDQGIHVQNYQRIIKGLKNPAQMQDAGGS